MKKGYWVKEKQDKDFSKACFCVGPQNDDLVCPCKMTVSSIFEKSFEKELNIINEKDTEISPEKAYIEKLEKLLGKLDLENCSEEEINLWQKCHSKWYN